MCDRYPGYLVGGTPVSSWDRGFNMMENRGTVNRKIRVRERNNMQIQHQYRGRGGPPRFWGSMSEGGGVSNAGGDTAKTNLIVNYLPQSMTEKDLYGMFMNIGPIESCRVMKDFKTGYSYGFGFVNFTREEDAARAIDMYNGYQLRNKRLKVSYARPSGEDIKETNLYVTNLPRAINEEQLEVIFGKYGRIVQKHILRDKNNGTPRGVAFVRFDKREEAQEAIAALNNVIPEGGTEPLSVKVAEEHGKQKAAYYAGWTAGFHHHRGDYTWDCEEYDPWEQFPSPPPVPASLPNTPRNGCRPPCARLPYPNFVPGKGNRGRGRNLPWAPEFPDQRFKGQRCRNGPSPYW